MKDILGGFKTDILQNVNKLIDDKLDSANKNSSEIAAERLSYAQVTGNPDSTIINLPISTSQGSPG